MMTHGELQIGQMVTVVRWEPRQEPGGFLATGPITINDQAYIGEVLKIIAIDLPFIAVTRGESDYAHSINLDRATIKELTPEFVKAMKGGRP